MITTSYGNDIDHEDDDDGIENDDYVIKLKGKSDIYNR